MYSDLKERTNKVAQIMMLSLSSQPVDHEENGRFKLRSTEIGKILSQMYRCAINKLIMHGEVYVLIGFNPLNTYSVGKELF